MERIKSLLIDDTSLKLLIIFIAVDVIFGILRSIKEHSIASTIGIDGIIRKVGMLVSIIVCMILDYIIDVNLIGFIPQNLIDLMPIQKVGIATLFNILYIMFEILSIFKNMIRCELPIPKKLQIYLERILKEFTNE